MVRMHMPFGNTVEARYDTEFLSDGFFPEKTNIRPKQNNASVFFLLLTYLRILNEFASVYCCIVNSALVVPERHARYSSPAMLSLFHTIKVSRIS